MKKAKFNIVDILVLVVLIAGIAFVGLRMFGGEETPVTANPTEGNRYRVTFYTESVAEPVASTLVQGSKAENSSRNMDLGHLVEFSTDESVIHGFDSEGRPVLSSKEGYVSVTMVCELTGFQQETGLQVGQYMLNIGHGMGVRCGNTEIYAYVYNIEPVA